MPRFRNKEPRRRLFILDATEGKPLPGRFDRETGKPITGGIDHKQIEFGPYKAVGAKPGEPGSDFQDMTEEEAKSSQVLTALRRGTLQQMPQQKPAARPKPTKPVPEG